MRTSLYRTHYAAPAASAAPDARALGAARSMDLLKYVLYSNDQAFVRDMVTQVALEVAREQSCPELEALLAHARCSPQLYRCLFFLLLDFHPKFRLWVLEQDATGLLGLQAVCPYKAVRFLKTLRADIAPAFLVNETLRLDDLERSLKTEYLRA